ncbi:hypothetical protein DVH05_004306 [Phytophthora capsici]|nr:hypothetical protein DVH05_004306 [Phytophthora capsici]
MSRVGHSVLHPQVQVLHVDLHIVQHFDQQLKQETLRPALARRRLRLVLLVEFGGFLYRVDGGAFALQRL